LVWALSTIFVLGLATIALAFLSRYLFFTEGHGKTAGVS
jgi:hypothetical protein